MGRKDERSKVRPDLLGVKTLEFQLTVGVVPGYGHDNPAGRVSPAQQVADEWQRISEDLFADYKVYPAGTVVPGRTLYPTEFGCPKGGETTVTVSGLANPHYVDNLDMWRFVVEKAADRLRKKLGQVTAYLSFRRVRFQYLVEPPPF